MDSYFTSKDIHLAEKRMNRWATSLSVRECELRPQARAWSLAQRENTCSHMQDPECNPQRHEIL